MAKVRANDIFRAIQKPDKLKANPGLALTGYQSAAIESDPALPSLIIAGAGSGKTELMAIRILWLVANRYAKPENILGLTFTRKAAASFSHRVNSGLRALQATDFWPAELEAGFTPPAISTYNSYANSLFRDAALALGFEPEAPLLSEAQRFQLARQVVINKASKWGDLLEQVDVKPEKLAGYVLSLAGELNDHERSAEEVSQLLRSEIQFFDGIPQNSKVGKNKFELTQKAKELIQKLELIPVIADLAQEFQIEKHRLGFVDFSDQVLLAKKALAETDLAESARSLYQHVLLDEYQDTSYLQTQLLAGLFKGLPVYAVGDPNQSIYGWRGASSSNLAEFLSEFRQSEAQEVQKFDLPTSWRNPEVVLSLANEVVKPLKVKPDYSSQNLVPVAELEPRTGANEGQVELDFLETLQDEADKVASWFESHFETARENGDRKLPTAALLLRARSRMPIFVSALQNRGIAVEVVGLGGLLQMPEVVDVVSALKAIHSPANGAALIRLLSGARWRVGAKDIAALNRFARQLAKNHADEDDGYGADFESSIIDATDVLATSNREWHTDISEAGLERIKDAGQVLRRLRQRQGLSLQELVRAVESELWLDIELRANPSRINPMQNLNAFANIVGSFDSNNNSGLGAFLEWLEYAKDLERFDSGAGVAQGGMVQVMTIHASKGLEWDLVAVADRSRRKKQFPAEFDTEYDPLTSLNNIEFWGESGADGWLQPGKLPFSLRGDKASLPQLSFAGIEHQKEAVDERLQEFKSWVAQMLEREERRLMYVAVTRSKENLLVTGSRFRSEAGTKYYPDQYLEQLLVLKHSQLKKNPDIRRVWHMDEVANSRFTQTASWPLHPIGDRNRKAFDRAVSESVDWKSRPDALGADLAEQIEMLLEERAARAERLNEVELPVRISASRFKDFVNDPDALAARFKRPVPEQPYKSTMQGTLFHSWIEKRFAKSARSDDGQYPDAEYRFDLDADQEDIELSAEQLQVCAENFEASRWFGIEPREVECEVQVTVGANTFVCKMDAVFDTEDGVEIIDWKTGKLPDESDEHEMRLRTLQLALYRMAYSALTGIPEEKIQVSLFFVNHGKEIRPARVPSTEELLGLWRSELLDKLS